LNDLLSHDPTPDPLQATVQLDRIASLAAADAVHHLVVELEAAPAPVEDQALALELALVIDVSGSMSGEPLEFARAAALGVVDALGPADRLALVSFATDSRVDLPAQAMDEAGRAEARQILRDLRTRGTTALAAGWADGCRAVAPSASTLDGTAAEESAARRRQVVVLSDGHANVGLTDPAELGRHAAEVLARGVATSAVGIGARYSNAQLEALAEFGGGRLHHAARPEEIVEVVLGELGESRRIAAERIELRIGRPDGVLLEDLHGCPVRSEGGTSVFAVGPLAAGSRRELVVRVLCRASEESGRPELPVALRWHAPGDRDGRLMELGRPAIERGLFDSDPDPTLAARVARAWQADTLRKVLRLRDDGLDDQARTLLQRHLPLFRGYTEGLPDGRRLTKELERLERSLDRRLAPESMKELRNAAFKLQKGQADLRASAPASWQELLEEDGK